MNANGSRKAGEQKEKAALLINAPKEQNGNRHKAELIAKLSDNGHKAGERINTQPFQQSEKFRSIRGRSLAQAGNWKLTTLQSSEIYSPSQFPFENSDYKLSKSLNLYSSQEFSDSLNPNQLTYFNNVESEMYMATTFHLETII